MAACLIDSATVLVVRDGENSLEVLMVRRHHKIDFAGGAYVFPGGKYDAKDALVKINAKDQYPDDFKDYIYTGAREVFEESGLLLGETELDKGHLQETKGKISTGEMSLEEFYNQLDIQLNNNCITPFARWVTPKDYHKRFDTRFYLAKAPEGQEIKPDDQEVVEAIWVQPTEFVEEFKNKMMFPTIMNLKLLGKANTVEQAFQQANERDIMALEPQIRDGKRYINPGAGYEEIDQKDLLHGEADKKD